MPSESLFSVSRRVCVCVCVCVWLALLALASPLLVKAATMPIDNIAVGEVISVGGQKFVKIGSDPVKGAQFMALLTPCESSDHNCAACSNLTTCSQCKSNYLLQAGVCIPAASVVTGCATSDGTKCTTCASGRYLVSGTPGSCSTCPASCSTCTSNTSCQSCSSGYVMAGGTCRSATPNSANGMNMQDFTSEYCSAFAKPAANGYTLVGTLKDSRDGKWYEIRKFADGKCWMADNLAYGGTTDACINRATFDGNGLATPTNRFGSGTYGDCRDPSNCVPNAWIDCTCVSGGGCGYMYNWQAAMQQASAYYNNTYSGPAGNVQGICPPGWHVPSGSATGEFAALDRANGGTGGSQSTAASTYFWRPGYAYKAVYAGMALRYDDLDSQGYFYGQWSSSEDSQYRSWYLSVDDSYLEPGSYGTDKYWGFSVRCVKDGCQTDYLTGANGSCVPAGSVVPNCVKSDGQKCTACTNQFSLQNGSCVKVEHCIAYDGLRCTACGSGYGIYGDGSTCVAAEGTMQSWNDCAALATPTATNFTQGPYLADTRDGKIYEIRKFADGKCWMVDNLAYGGASDACANKTSFAGASNLSGAAWGYGDCRNNPGYADYLYNWQAAVQLPSAYYGNAVVYPSGVPSLTNHLQGICPSGWHLPSGDNTTETSEFAQLDIANGGTGGNQSCGATASCNFWRPGYGYKGVYSGYALASGSLYYQGLNLYNWSANETENAVTSHAFLLFASGNQVGGGNFTYTKYDGYPVRCIKN